MKTGIPERLEAGWGELKDASSDGDEGAAFRYRRVDLGPDEKGIRVAVSSDDRARFLLIELDSATRPTALPKPKWMGMEIDRIKVDLPSSGSIHVRFRLNQEELQRVFLTVCTDFIVQLLDRGSRSRSECVADGIIRWNRFFSRFGHKGLSGPAQQGLWGELLFLRETLMSRLTKEESVAAWKAPAATHVDFECRQNGFEVKTTRKKEPRSFRISNERQLDDTGFDSLHVALITVDLRETEGHTLPKVVQDIRDALLEDSAALGLFEAGLFQRGYLDAHAAGYTDAFRCRKKELFRVTDGFPRIVDLPVGVGDLKYSVQVSACGPFSTEYEMTMDALLER